VLFVAFLRSIQKFRSHPLREIGLLAFVIFLSANTHFFNAALIGSVTVVFMAYIFLQNIDSSLKIKYAAIFVSLLSVAAVLTVIINKPAIWFMFSSHRPNPAAHPAFSLSKGLQTVIWSWRWFSVPAFLYVAFSILGLLHPNKERRYFGFS